MRKISGWKKALASTAVALGLAGSGPVAGNAFGRRGGQRARGQQTQPQTGLQALVFVDDYKPGVGFRMVSKVQQPTVNQILGYVDPANPNQGDGAVVDPTDWNGYIITYAGCGPGNYNLIFLREGILQQGQTYSFTTNAVYFSNQLQLLESEIRTGTGRAPDETEGAEGTEGGGEGAEGTTTEETTTTEGTTTETTDGTTTTTPGETTTTTPPDETTTTTETPTENGTTTTEEVVVNATETENGE